MIKRKRINLAAAARRPVRAGRRLDRLYVALNFLIAALLIGTLAAALVMSSSAKTASERLAETEKAIAEADARIAAQVGDRGTYSSYVANRDRMKEILSSAQAEPRLTFEVLIAVWTCVDGCEASGFQLDSGVLSFSVYSEVAANITAAVKGLRESGLFESVGFGNSITLSEQKYQSRLTLKIKGGGAA